MLKATGAECTASTHARNWYSDVLGWCLALVCSDDRELAFCPGAAVAGEMGCLVGMGCVNAQFDAGITNFRCRGVMRGVFA